MLRRHKPQGGQVDKPIPFDWAIQERKDRISGLVEDFEEDLEEFPEHGQKRYEYGNYDPTLEMEFPDEVLAQRERGSTHTIREGRKAPILPTAVLAILATVAISLVAIEQAPDQTDSQSGTLADPATTSVPIEYCKAAKWLSTEPEPAKRKESLSQDQLESIRLGLNNAQSVDQLEEAANFSFSTWSISLDTGEVPRDIKGRTHLEDTMEGVNQRTLSGSIEHIFEVMGATPKSLSDLVTASGGFKIQLTGSIAPPYSAGTTIFRGTGEQPVVILPSDVNIDTGDSFARQLGHIIKNLVCPANQALGLAELNPPDKPYHEGPIVTLNEEESNLAGIGSVYINNNSLHSEDNDWAEIFMLLVMGKTPPLDELDPIIRGKIALVIQQIAAATDEETARSLLALPDLV